jgi:Fic family protein
MTGYVYDQQDWPKFRWNHDHLASQLAGVHYNHGRLIGRMDRIGSALRVEATLQTLTEDVLKSSEIDDDALDPAQVRSSVGRRLGMRIGALAPADQHVDRVVGMTLDATQGYDAPLTVERLFGWHAALFAAERSGMSRTIIGAWRNDSTGPTQVVAGLAGRATVHYQAPPANRVDPEMRVLLDWFNSGGDPVIKAAVAHLWFLTIHPFGDGNGRIARAIADMALARSERSAQRFYSMSAQIRRERVAYYAALEAAQHGDLDITPWLEWFFGCLDRAIGSAERMLSVVLRKARFWEMHAGTSANARQRASINRVLDGFDTKLTSSNWAVLAKCSQDTALRDIADLMKHGILIKDAARGRSTFYSLVERS